MTKKATGRKQGTRKGEQVKAFYILSLKKRPTEPMFTKYQSKDQQQEKFRS